MSKTSVYVDDKTKARLDSIKPSRQTMVNFLNTLADIWQGLTEQERAVAILAHRQNQQPKEAK